MEALEQWVQEAFAPIVLTCTSSEVERISRKNNLSFADLLNGFGILEQADTPVRSVSHHFTLSRFNFRFISARQFSAVPVQDATRMLNDAIARNPPANAGAIDLDVPMIKGVDDVPGYLRAVGVAGASEPLPWYRDFKQTLLDSFRCEEYSMLFHPAVILLAVSSTEGSPRHSFEELAATRNLPPAFHEGLYDPSIPKYYVLVHDVAETEGTSIDPNAILSGLNVPAAYSSVLRLNSLPTTNPCSTNAHIWESHPYVRQPMFPARVDPFPAIAEAAGCMMSDFDLTNLNGFVQDFGVRFVLPALEARIFQLNEIVSAMKKGVKNVFKSWLRKPKDLSSRSNGVGGVMYRFDAIEAQTRLLADTAFMVQDYDLALQMYRLARDDFKSDKSMFHCANANEMIALCLLLTKGSPMQIANALDAASGTYARVNNQATCRLAVRTAVIAGEVFTALSHSGLFTDYMDSASTALIRGSTMEQGICSAALIERAAYCDVSCRVPRYRKYGFRLVMAGHVYSSLGHNAHSARCYALARGVYDCSGWFQVEDHINFTLAQQAYRLSDPMASINLFLKLIGTGRNSASQQEALLEEFQYIVRDFLKDGEVQNKAKGLDKSVKIEEQGFCHRRLVVKDLCMPELDDKSAVVFAPMNAMGIDRSVDGNQSDEDVWKALEVTLKKEQLIHDTVRASQTNVEPLSWLKPTPSILMPFRGNKGNQVHKPAQYATGERIYVEFVMKNALSCAVNVQDVHLLAKFEKRGEQSKLLDVPDDQASHELIAVERVNLQLLPCTEERVRLALVPKVPGVVTILGVRWAICGGDVCGEHHFDIPGPLLQDTRAHRETRARAPNMMLMADVVGPMPWLGIKINNPFDSCFIGEVVKMEVHLTNSGNADLSGLRLCCRGALICMADTEDLQMHALMPYIGPSGHVVDLQTLVLHPGETRRMTMWVRCLQPPENGLRLLFQYALCSQDPLAKQLQRSVRVKLPLNCTPSVDISCAVSPSYGSTRESVLAIDVSNVGSASNGSRPGQVVLDKVISFSSMWRLEAFQSPTERSSSAIAATHLGPGEASTIYLRVIPNETEEKQHIVSLNKEIRISDETLSSCPYHQFLCLEHALNLMTSAKRMNGGTAQPDGTQRGGFRTIQSVRRENKALREKNDPTDTLNGTVSQQLEPQPTSTEALYFPKSVDGHVVLIWSIQPGDSSPQQSIANVRQVIGQSSVTSISVRSASPSIGEHPLRMTLEYCSTAEMKWIHSEGEHRMAVAELDVLLTIRHEVHDQAAAVDFRLELLSPQDIMKRSFDQQQRPVGGSRFYWSGFSKKTFSSFAAGEEVRLPLKACFTTPGIYDLNRLRIHLHSASEASNPRVSVPPARIIEFPQEYLVYVKPPNDTHGLPP